MIFANRMQATAARLLSKFDERETKAVLIRAGSQQWDPIEDELITLPATDHELTGVAVSYSHNLINGTTILNDDIKFVCTHEHEPKTADKVHLDGVDYSVVSVKANAYTGLDKVINYEIQLRK